MRSLVVNESKFKDTNCFKDGSEATIHRYGPQLVLKKFNKKDTDTLTNKLNKILILNQFDYDFLVKPEYLAIDRDEQLLGYIMKRVNYQRYENIMDLAYDSSLTIKDKLAIIYDLEKMILTLNNHDVFILDYNPANIMFDKNNEIRLIDTDNFMVEGYNPDVMACNYIFFTMFNDCPYTADRFSFLMCALDILNNSQYNTTLFKDCYTLAMLQTVLKNAKLPRELKRYVSKILNNPTEADIISPKLASLDFSSYDTARTVGGIR